MAVRRSNPKFCSSITLAELPADGFGGFSRHHSHRGIEAVTRPNGRRPSGRWHRGGAPGCDRNGAAACAGHRARDRRRATTANQHRQKERVDAQVHQIASTPGPTGEYRSTSLPTVHFRSAWRSSNCSRGARLILRNSRSSQGSVLKAPPRGHPAASAAGRLLAGPRGWLPGGPMSVSSASPLRR